MSAATTSRPEGLVAMKLRLLSMPFEVLCAIVLLLDPISLIAASQTSRALRTFINPTRHDFIQRLLALKLLPESGGIVPLLRRRAAEERERLTLERAAYYRYCTRADFPTSTLVKYNPLRINWDFDFGPADIYAEDAEKALYGTERYKRAYNYC
ncbi:hypothetical protein QBC39DRAFT_430916 [Podospora conica]|nr:hypothetical protein QBC39DRAFT_430916 [Schizothecium conicum]